MTRRSIPISTRSPENWFLGISPEGIGLIGMMINFAVAAVVMKMTKPTPIEIQEMVEGIRNPKGSSEAHAH